MQPLFNDGTSPYRNARELERLMLSPGDGTVTAEVADRSVDGAAPFTNHVDILLLCHPRTFSRPTAAFRTTSSTCSWEMPTSALRGAAVAPVVHGG